MSVSSLFLQRTAGVLASAALLSPLAHAQQTAPPNVSMYASIKQLHFDWDPAPNATYYELLFHAPGSTSVFFTLPASQTSATNNISAHLFDWDRWSYGVNACRNSTDCSEGFPPNTTKSLMQDAIGYIKPSVTNERAYFGHRVALAEDGNTFAVMSREEPVGSSRAAPFYVFTKIAGKWRQQARMFPSSTMPHRNNVGFESFYSGSLAMSQDGNTLMVGMPFRIARNYFGYNNSVSIYRRSGNSWALEHQVVSPDQVETEPLERQYYARMNVAGNRIVYRLNDQVQMLERGSSGWTTRAIPQPPYTNCRDTRLSGDGNTIAYFCGGSGTARVFLARNPDWVPVMAFDPGAPQVQVPNALALNYDASLIAVSSNEYVEQCCPENPTVVPREVRVYREKNGAWQQFGNTLRAGSWSSPENGYTFGDQLEFSRNGSYLAVAYEEDRGQGTGVWSPPLVSAPGSNYSGAVYVYEFPSTGPRLRRVVKPNVEGLAAMSGMDLSLANDGKTLLIGQPAEKSKSTGIDGDRTDASRVSAGAAWLY